MAPPIEKLTGGPPGKLQGGPAGGGAGGRGAGGAGGGPGALNAGQGANDTNTLLDKSHQGSLSKKILRILTVAAYLFFVSFAAIVLGVYYAFFWEHKPNVSRHGMPENGGEPAPPA